MSASLRWLAVAALAVALASARRGGGAASAVPPLVGGVGEPLDVDNFERVVVASHHVWVVEVMSGMCGSCQAFAPLWQASTVFFVPLRWVFGRARRSHQRMPRVGGGRAAELSRGMRFCDRSYPPAIVLQWDSR